MAKISSQFTNLYSLSKTVRFRLIPQGATYEHMVTDNILKEDDERAQQYDEAKALIDGYHRVFIDKVLSSSELDWSKLGAIYDCLRDKGDTYTVADKEEEENILRENISRLFTKDKEYEDLSKEKLFSKILPEYYKDKPEKLEILRSFDRFTSYFVGFFENRKNIYSSEDIASSIGHRIVSDNFAKFYGNVQAFRRLMEIMPENLHLLENNLSRDFDPISLAEWFSVNGFNHVLSEKGIEMYNTIIGGSVDKYEDVFNATRIIEMDGTFFDKPDLFSL